MTQKKFLVLGSNSFSGSNFVKKALLIGHQVFGISRSKQPNSVFLPYLWEKNNSKKHLINKFNFAQLNLNTELDSIMQIVDSFKPNYIVNFAAQGMVAESWQKPTHWYTTNLLSQVAFHDQIRKKDFLEKYLHITTPEVYGSTNDGWINENTRFNPSTPYAVSRAACDMHLKSFFSAYGFPVIFTRAANVYGPGQQLYRVIPKTILSARTGKKMLLHGGGESSRSFIHIDDVVNATMKLAISGEPGTTWHLSTKESIKIKELVKKICKMCNVEFCNTVDISQERLGKDQNYHLDSKNMRDKHSWEDKISLFSGIKETIKWVDDNLDLLCKLPWEYKHKA